MPEGKVKWFNEKKGFGFFEQDNRPDPFVHHTSITGEGFKTLSEGQKVRFGVEETSKVPKAKDVQIISIRDGIFPLPHRDRSPLGRI